MLLVSEAVFSVTSKQGLLMKLSSCLGKRSILSSNRSLVVVIFASALIDFIDFLQGVSARKLSSFSINL